MLFHFIYSGFQEANYRGGIINTVLLGSYCWDCTVGIVLLGSIGSQQYIVHRTVGIFEVLFLFTVIAVLLVNYVVALLLLFF